MTFDGTCPIWGTPAKIIPTPGVDGIHADSPRAGGPYKISGSAKMQLQSRDASYKVKATTWLIEQRRFGVECPVIKTNIFDEIERRALLPVNLRADQLLKYIESKTPTIGDLIKVMPSGLEGEFLAVSESTKKSEGSYLIDFLIKRNWLEKASNSNFDFTEYGVTPDGYEHLADLRMSPVESTQAFVAMWFDKTLGELWSNGIEPAIRDAGYEPLRIDKKDHNNKIDDEIIAEIKRSRFIVADFTHGDDGMRGGVYYEAGFAHGLNIPVIFTCRKDLIDNHDIHFDTRQYNHITWEPDKLDDLRKSLTDRISATIGDGPL